MIVRREILPNLGRGTFQPVALVDEIVSYEDGQDNETHTGKVARKEDVLESGRAVEYVEFADSEGQLFKVRTNDLCDTVSVRFFPET